MQAAALDDEEAVIAPRDTLTLSFDDLAAGTDARDWYLALDGVPLNAEAVASRAGKTPDEPGTVPVAFRLHQNVPNPFARSTRIGFDLPVAASIRLEIFDLQGRVVRRVAGRWPAGRHVFEWDLRDDRGRPLPHGVYAYRLRSGGYEARLKLVVMP